MAKHGINVNQALIRAGLKAGPKTDDVVTASSGQSILIHVKNREPQLIQKIVAHLQKQDWVGVLFTAAQGVKHQQPDPGKKPVPEVSAMGWVPGTFSLELIHMDNEERGPDIVLTFPWSSEKNSFGYAGMDYDESSGESGPRTGPGSGHGSMSPWCIRNTMIAWGVDFKDRRTISVPVGNVDIVPTILALKGIDYREPLDGRVLLEALKGGPDEAQIPYATQVYTSDANNGQYKTVIQANLVGNHRYIAKSWRIQ